MKLVRTINNYDDLVACFKECKSEGFKTKHVLTYKEGEEQRRDKQNRLYYHWLRQIAYQSENSEEYERGYYKWTYGCPILAEEDEWFNENVYLKLMDTYTYEEIIDVMGKETINVTSLMTVKQMNRYIMEMKADAEKREIVLTDLDDIYYQLTYGAKK